MKKDNLKKYVGSKKALMPMMNERIMLKNKYPDTNNKHYWNEALYISMSLETIAQLMDNQCLD